MYVLGCMAWNVPVTALACLLYLLNIQPSDGAKNQGTVAIEYENLFIGSFLEMSSEVEAAIAQIETFQETELSNISKADAKTVRKAMKENMGIFKQLKKYQTHSKVLKRHLLKFKEKLELYLDQNTFEKELVEDIQYLIGLLHKALTFKFRTAEGEMFAMKMTFNLLSLDGSDDSHLKNKDFLSIVLNATNKRSAFKQLSRIRKKFVDLIEEGSTLIKDLETKLIAKLKFKPVPVITDEPGVKLILREIYDEVENYGSLKVNDFGAWYYLCDKGWSDKTSQVVCRELGYDPTRAVTIKSGLATYGEADEYIGSKLVISSKILCGGNETRLSQCHKEEWKLGSQNCEPNNYIAIACGNKRIIKTRLADGSSLSGRPEVFYKGNWANLCTSNTRKDRLELFAYLTCENTGLKGRNAFTVPYSQFGKGTSDVSVELDCPQPWRFPTLQLCRLREVKSCSHVSVFCFENEPKIDAFVKCLSLGGYYKGHGLVRFCEEFEQEERRRWDGSYFNPFVNFATVCGNNFGIKESQVVCRQSGFNPADAALNTFGLYDECIEGGDDIKMSDVQCKGDEKNLAECTFKYGENVTCPGNKRASLFCTPIPVRIDDDQSLHMFVNEDWRRICATNWGVEEAKVVCRQLGKPYGNASGYAVPGDSQNAWITDVNCQGDERHIGQCDYNADFSLDLLTDDYHCSYWNRFDSERFNPGITEYLDYDFYNCNDGGYAAINCQ
ncbi:unnamed protein product [Owenia fusiformis]|uniref:SRCR domain-containing protein n=1 Tax=Owenia fusiformis TaxID=6347 RepID=A0A8S4P487_OWEFU|nr:unnamed protein product [Owenia fusiformis]